MMDVQSDSVKAHYGLLVDFLKKLGTQLITPATRKEFPGSTLDLTRTPLIAAVLFLEHSEVRKERLLCKVGLQQEIGFEKVTFLQTLDLSYPLPSLWNLLKNEPEIKAFCVDSFETPEGVLKLSGAKVAVHKLMQESQEVKGRKGISSVDVAYSQPSTIRALAQAKVNSEALLVRSSEVSLSIHSVFNDPAKIEALHANGTGANLGRLLKKTLAIKLTQPVLAAFSSARNIQALYNSKVTGPEMEEILLASEKLDFGKSGSPLRKVFFDGHIPNTQCISLLNAFGANTTKLRQHLKPVSTVMTKSLPNERWVVPTSAMSFVIS
jgi:hypothetical protein